MFIPKMSILNFLKFFYIRHSWVTRSGPVLQKIDKLYELRDLLTYAIIDDDCVPANRLRTQIDALAIEIALLEELPPVFSVSDRGFYEIVPEIGNNEG